MPRLLVKGPLTLLSAVAGNGAQAPTSPGAALGPAAHCLDAMDARSKYSLYTII